MEWREGALWQQIDQAQIFGIDGDLWWYATQLARACAQCQASGLTHVQLTESGAVAAAQKRAAADAVWHIRRHLDETPVPPKPPAPPCMSLNCLGPQCRMCLLDDVSYFIDALQMNLDRMYCGTL